MDPDQVHPDSRAVGKTVRHWLGLLVTRQVFKVCPVHRPYEARMEKRESLTADAGHGARHMPQLDGLRAFAVAGVLVHHFLEVPLIGPNLAYGRLGVQLFFVLSGYLITGILLRDRDAAAQSGKSLAAVARGFYIRRMLRIFPIYYLVLLVVDGDLNPRDFGDRRGGSPKCFAAGDRSWG